MSCIARLDLVEGGVPGTLMRWLFGALIAIWWREHFCSIGGRVCGGEEMERRLGFCGFRHEG